MKEIIEQIQVLAMDRMTEDGIHHDDFPDREADYAYDILEELGEVWDIDLTT